MHEKLEGITFILAASTAWAIEPVFAKLSYLSSDFIHTSFIRALFAMMVAFLYLKLRGKRIKVRKEKLLPLAYIAIAGTAFADLIYFLAISQIPVVNAVLIGHMQPLFIVIIGSFTIHEKLSKYDYAGMLLMIIAGILVSSRSMENLLSLHLGSIGDALVLIATVTWATTSIAMKKYLPHEDAGIITFYRFLIASLILSILSCSISIDLPNIWQIATGIVVGTGTIFYYLALHRLKAAQVASLELTTPFFATLLAFFVLKEMITPLQVAGILLMSVGVYMLSRRE